MVGESPLRLWGTGGREDQAWAVAVHQEMGVMDDPLVIMGVGQYEGKERKRMRRRL